jgi:hypothetical protein
MAKSKLTDIGKANAKIDELVAEKQARIDAESKEEEQLELRKQRLEITIAQNKALGETYTAKQNELKLLEVLKDMQGDAYKSTKDMQDLEKQIAAEKDAAKQKELQSRLENLKLLASENDELKALAEELIKNTKGTDKLTKAQEEAKESFDNTFGGLAVKVGLNSTAFNKFSDGITKFQELAKKNPKQMKESFQETFSLQKMGGAVLAQMIAASLELASATDKASAAFAANTGAGRIMTEQIADVGGQFRNIGLDAEKAGKAAQDLYNNFTGFMTVGKEGQKELMATVASLGKLGIDGATASKTLTLFNKNMGMSLKQSQKLTKQLAMMGTGIGISSSKMVKGFAESAKSLAVYGKDAVKIFSDLAAQAKAANVETSTLLGVAEKFDTFSGAADAAGKLNSILGSQMSATDMLTMSENERIETLIRSVQAQGVAFKDLDKYSQKAIGAAAGINDMAEAQRVFGMSVSDYRKGLKADPKEEEFQQSLKDTMDIMEKLKRIGQQFAISLAPVLDGLASFFQMILDANDAMGGYLIPILGTIIGLLVVVPKIIGLITPLMALFSTTAPAAAPGITLFSQALGAAAPNLLKGAVGLIAVGVAMLLLGKGFMMMGKGFGGDASKVGVGLIGLSVGLITLTGALATIGLAIGGTMGIGGGVLAIGLSAVVGGIMSLGYAISKLDGEKMKNFITLMEAFTGGKEMTADFNIVADVRDFTDDLIKKQATLKPMLGDLALIATGKTTQSVTTSTVGYSLNTFAAKFENTFKPNVTVKIGNEEFKDFVIDTQAKEARQ